MPPTIFIYLLFVTWIPSALLVWAAALLLLLSARTRRFAKPLCLAMTGTFPFVFLYQALTALPVAMVLLCWWLLWRLLEPHPPAITTNPLVIFTSICVGFFTLGSMLLATLSGFYDGWRTGWRWGEGQPLMEAASNAPVYRSTRGLLQSLSARRTRNRVKSS